MRIRAYRVTAIQLQLAELTDADRTGRAAGAGGVRTCDGVAAGLGGTIGANRGGVEPGDRAAAAAAAGRSIRAG